ncbi:hypothetical protein MBLNU459_g2105t1 [Dothideomycetes sp. NU459]
MARGRGRGSGRSLRLSARPPTAVVKDDVSDEEMLDEDTEAQAEDGDAATPALDAEGEPGAEAEAEAEAEPEAVDDDEGSDTPVVQTIPRKRGRGRPPNRVAKTDWNTPEPGGDDASESGTPLRRRRGRPSGGGGGWRGGFRGRPKGGPSNATRVPIDKEGNMMDVVDDEVALPEDAHGETKVDKNGHLQGGRDYRVRVFTIAGRGERLYMLSTEPARCTGFRDSYLFFTKHMQLFKIIIDDNEKKDLIARDIIPHSYKGRAIGVVTARSVFREFGARIIIGGRKVTDDYQVAAAKERGDMEGELADPHDRLPPPGEPYNKNQYVAWHGASQVYHNNQPSVPLQSGKPAGPKRKMNVTTGNWQFEHAREASRFNSSLTALRRANLDGVYDAHTNLMFYPKIMQPTHAKWEQILPDATAPSLPALNGDHANGHLTNGDSQHTSTVNDDSRPPVDSFKPVPDVVSRNFLVTDVYFETPPISNLGVPGPDGSVDDLGPNGLSDIPDHILDELPEDCRIALEQAKAAEAEWKGKWGTEATDGSRGSLRIGFNGFPV